MENFLKSITPDTDIDQVIASLEQAGVPESSIKFVTKLSTETKSLRDQLSNLWSFLDKDLDKFLDKISKSLTSYKAAVEATNFYTSEWFSKLPMSQNAKKSVAKSLIELSQPFGITNTFWEDIVNDLEVETIKYKIN